MELIKILGICFATTLFCIVLKNKNDELCFLTAVCGGIMILICIIKSTSAYLIDVRNFLSGLSIDTTAFTVALKALSISYLCQFAADLCRDFNQTSIGSKVELAGKCLILILCAPLIVQITKIAAGYIG